MIPVGLPFKCSQQIEQDRVGNRRLWASKRAISRGSPVHNRRKTTPPTPSATELGLDRVLGRNQSWD